jgi:inorganic pyrophosphatase
MSEIILKARIVGGLPMLDNGEADDKIIAVLENDNMWQDVTDVAQLPKVMVDRLRHYFSTYKMLSPDDAKVEIAAAYDRAHAEAVVEAAIADYRDHFGE